MKIKTDFVSNSSTSSFVVMGTNIDSSKFTEEDMPFFRDLLGKSELEFDEFQNNFKEYMDNILENVKLSYSFGYDGYYNTDFMIGMHYTEMKEDETLKDFKQRVSKAIKQCFNLDIVPYHIEEAWEDR